MFRYVNHRLLKNFTFRRNRLVNGWYYLVVLSTVRQTNKSSIILHASAKDYFRSYYTPLLKWVGLHATFAHVQYVCKRVLVLTTGHLTGIGAD